MKLVEAINFKSGIIVFDKFIDLDVSICEQESMLTEDMFQIIYNNSMIIDIGWTPEIDCNGHFRILLIKNYDWTNPVKSSFAQDIDELLRVVNQFVQLAFDSATSTRKPE